MQNDEEKNPVKGLTFQQARGIIKTTKREKHKGDRTMYGYYFDSYQYDKEIKADRNRKSEPEYCESSFEDIFAAYHDYRQSQQWN